MDNADNTQDEQALLEHVIAACQAAIANAMADPSQALGLARGLEGALDTLTLVSREVEKGDAGIQTVRDNAAPMVRGALASVLAHAGDSKRTSKVLDAVPNIVPQKNKDDGEDQAPVRSTPVANGTKPLFSEISHDYIKMRETAKELSNSDVKAHWGQRQLWLDIIGDRPIDQYFPRDLQKFVSAMKYWPASCTKIKEFKGLGTKEILRANAGLSYKPLARKTLEDKYVAFVKTMSRYGMNDYNYRDPFAGAKIRYPETAAPPRPREEIGVDVVNRTFELGVASGCLDAAILPPLALLTTRRLGLLLYLTGSDIRQKHGVFVVQSNGIQQVNGVWQRVPIKTDESMTFFVLHQFLVEIGLVEWAMKQDGWLFGQPHEHPDPSKYASQFLNRQMRQAGAVDDNVEVFHCLRGDAIDDLRDEGVEERSWRLQSGHEMSSTHDVYGRKSIRARECQRIATRLLDPAINWEVLRNLDFDALSRGRRKRGRRKVS